MRLLTLALFSLFSLPAHAQGRFEAGFIAEHAQMDTRHMRSFGAQVHIPIKERFTLNYHFGIGPSSLGGYYVHASGGGGAGLWLLSTFNDNATEVDRWIRGVGVFLLFIPEGVGYYINPEAKWKMHASLNPLGLEHWRHKGDPYYERTRLSCDVVFRVKRDLDENVWVAPHIGGKWIYRDGMFAGMIGAALGFQTKK